jgi:hypothetical protein
MSAGNVRGRAKPNQEFFVSFLRTKGHTNHGKALGVLAATHTFSAKMGWEDMATGMNQRPRQRPSWASCRPCWRRGSDRATGRFAAFRRSAAHSLGMFEKELLQSEVAGLAGFLPGSELNGRSTGRPATGRSSQLYRFGAWKRCVTLTCNGEKSSMARRGGVLNRFCQRRSKSCAE